MTDIENSQEPSQALLPEGAAEAAAEQAAEAAQDEAYKPSKPEFKWYVVQTYSSMENAVERSNKERVIRGKLDEKYGRILVPTEEVVEVKNGVKRTTSRKFYPGYVLIEMAMNDETWHLVKATNKVSGFLGGGKMHHPSGLPEREVKEIFDRMNSGSDKPRHKVEFEVGEVVRVTEGPFADFNGNVDEVNYEKSRVRLTVSIFGRPTPVDLDFAQIEKT